MKAMKEFGKRYILVGMVGMVMGVCTAASAQDETREQLTIPLSDPGKPGSLEVGLVNGSVFVSGYDGKEVVINAVARSGKGKHDDDDDRDHSEKPVSGGMKRISGGNSLELTAEERNNRVEVNSDSWKRAVDLTIKVPRQFSLKLSTVNRGTIVVENVRGEIEVNNVNGAIELKDIAGSVVANTVNGKLLVNFKEVTPNTPMAFTTLNGNIDVTLPANVKALTKLKSERGEIYSDFDMAIEKSQPKVDRSNRTGSYRVSIEDWVYGKINGGGPEILFKNMNGNIYVRRAK